MGLLAVVMGYKNLSGDRMGQRKKSESTQIITSCSNFKSSIRKKFSLILLLGLNN